MLAYFTKRKKLSIFLIIAVFVTSYALVAFVPYMGRVYVSEATREAFAMENFFGEAHTPERVLLLEAPQEAFSHRMNIISRARERIILVSFDIKTGETPDIIMGGLLAAADRGVQVYFMYNAVGGSLPARYARVLSAHENITLYRFNPLNFLRPTRLNSAKHDKYMVIDNSYMIIGGRNLADRYFVPESFTGRVAYDREVLVYNSDPAFQGVLASLADYFFEKAASPYTSRLRTGRPRPVETAALISRYSTFRPNHQNFNYAENTVPTYRITLLTNSINAGKNDSVVAYNLLRLTQNSPTVLAQAPYVSLTNRNFQLLLDATADRDVTLLTNSLSSAVNIPAYSVHLRRRPRLARSNINLYEFQSTRTSLHTKTYLFGDRLTAIGSFNLNERSTRADAEAIIIIDSPAFHAQVTEAINTLQAQSLRVNAQNRYYPHPYLQPAHVPLHKRALYTAAGFILRPFWFMF